jgi:hypothetical protein
MFLNQKHFVIHAKNQPCDTRQNNSINSLSNNDNNVHNQIVDFIQTTYPKQKYLPILFKIMEPHNLIGKNLFFTSFSNIHIADFCSFINNKFAKLANTDTRFIKLCKYLQTQEIRFPKIAVKNPVAHKYLCH